MAILDPQNKTINLLAMCLCLIIVAILGSGPNADGDLWWQMVYGKYLLENGTLIPDHTIFSWTNSTNATIYCAWITEILLYLIYEIAGLPGMFALRYLVMLSPALLMMWLAKRYYGSQHVLNWLGYMLCYLAAFVTGGLLKPELFSLLFVTLILANYFALKQEDQSPWWRCYVFPLIMLIWVNSHGAFFIGMVLLGCIGVGEVLNFLTKSRWALSLETLKHLGLAALITMFTVMLTPYGLEYPLQIINSALNSNETHFASVTAYQSVFDPSMRLLRHPIYLYGMIALTLPLIFWLLWRRKWDFSIVFFNIAFIYLYTHYTRLTYFYAVVFLFTLQFLLANISFKPEKLKNIPIGKIFTVVGLAGVLVLGGYRIKDRFDYPSINSWYGFGISYLNPVDEAEFIKSNLSDKTICNDYDGGGYLMWELWPQQKVMIDPRYFPYSSWYDHWINFLAGRNIPELVGRLQCDVWYLNHKLQKPITYLNKSPEWQTSFYGRGGVVFTRNATVKNLDAMQMSENIRYTNEPWRYVAIINFALNSKHFKQAMIAAKQYLERFEGTKHEAKAQRALAQVEGMIAYHLHDIDKAVELLTFAATEPVAITNTRIRANVHQHLTQRKWQAQQPLDALKAAEQALSVDDKNPVSIYNVALLRWHLFKDTGNASDTIDQTIDWRTMMQQFLEITEKTPEKVTPLMIQNAKNLLAGKDNVNIVPMAQSRLPAIPEEDRLP